MKEIQSDDFIPIEEPLSTILVVINGISCILGSFGNIVLILTIFFHKQLRGASEMLLVSLGLTDFLSCAVFIPLLMIRIDTTQKLPTMMNQSRRAIGQATAVSASLNLLMLTANQFIFFYRPLRSVALVRKKYVLTEIILIHIIAIGCGVYAYQDMVHSQYIKTAIIGTALMLFFGLHYAICSVVSEQQAKVTNQQLSLQHNYQVTSHVMHRAKRNARTIMLFGILYLVTWLPVTIFQIWFSFSNDSETFQQYFYLLSSVQQISSVVDPFLCCQRNIKVRAVFRKMFPRKKNKIDVAGENTGRQHSTGHTSSEQAITTRQHLSSTSKKTHVSSPKHVQALPQVTWWIS